MRKLAIASFSFSAAIFAANYILSRESVLYAALVCALAGAAVLGIRLRSLKGLVIALFAAAVGFAVYAVHYDMTIEKAHRLSGEKREYSFELLENPQKYSDYTSVEVRIDDGTLGRLKGRLYDYDGNLDELRAGDRIGAEVKMSAADIRYGVRTLRYNARGIYLTGTLKGEFRLLGHRSSLGALLADAAERIVRRAETVFPADTAPFIKGLMLGDKNDLYDDDALYVALSRAGLMHVAAVSGMHVSYLVAFLQFLIGKGKKGALICLPLVWIFVALSGMSPSALRAAFMQTMLLIAPLFERENDPLTSLSAALGVLLLCNPFAAANISLQLSFTCMLGVVLLFERLQEVMMQPLGEGKTAKLLRAPVGVISCSLSVMVFTLPIMAACFGYISILSPLTNLLCLWAVPICFVGSFASCALYGVPILGKLLIFGVSGLAHYLIAVCRFISSLPFSVVYLSGWINTLWIVLFYLSLTLVFLLKCKPKWKLTVPIVVALISLLVSQAALRWYYSSARETITAIDVGQGQCVSVMSGGRTVLIDCGSTSYAEYNAGDCAAAYLKGCGINRIDALVFTHLHADHVNGFERLSNLMEIGVLIIPENVDTDSEAFEEILSCAMQHEIEIRFISENENSVFGDIHLALFAVDTEKGGNERCMTVVASVDDYDVIITGDSPASREKELCRREDLSDIEAIIVGHHGSKSSSCEEYLAEVSGEKAIISVGKNNYGLPSPEVLERLEAFGYTVYRTDLNGNVEIRIDG